MTKFWIKLTQDEIQETVQQALNTNVDYEKQAILGVPASYLDNKVFYQDASFIKDAPYIQTLVSNPNHIGCHTIGDSESFFSGTQDIERKLINMCAVDILKGQPGEFDGYVASGGTEANMQAVWVYRNYYRQEYKARNSQIAIICSEDTHYSVDKAADIFGVDVYKVGVDTNSRKISAQGIFDQVSKARSNGVRFFIVICNMMTTMFGSIDDVDAYSEVLSKSDSTFRIHVDGAYGGFYYPFTQDDEKLSFANEHVTSFTLDAHKMAQAPYGTGIFLIRKGLIQYTVTREASYVKGADCTLIGSRSGANAVAIWMILVKNGPFGWAEKIFILQKRTEWMCARLRDAGISFYRHPKSNIIAIRKEFIDNKVAEKYGLVPDDHNHPNWYKIVVMEHVTIEKLMGFLGK